MRVIITGGTGSIGVPLADILIASGHEVVVLSRDPDHAPDRLSIGVNVRRWDASNGDGWFDLINHRTAIVNLAGKHPANWRWTPAHKQAVLDSRMNAAHAVIDACQRAAEKPAVLVQASAVGYYGDSGQAVTTEDAPPGDTWRATVCRQWEARLQAVEMMGIRVAYLRIGIVLDPAGGTLPPFILAAKLMGRRLGDGKQWIPWVHNADVAGAICFLLQADRLSGVFNVCAPNPVQNHTFLKSLTGMLSRPALIPVPAVALKLAMGEQANVVLDSQRIIPQRLLDAGYTFQYPLLDDALRDLL